jgi:Tol biopolymer transport system component
MVRIAKYIIYLIIITFPLMEVASGQGPTYLVKPVSFSSSLSNEIAPVLFKDGIIFCSDRKTSSINATTNYNDERLYNLWFVEWKDSVSSKQPPEIKSNTNTILYYGPLCFAPDGRTVYFTSSQLSRKAAKNRNIQNPMGIFTGELTGTIITNVKPFEYNNPKYSIFQPSVSKDGKKLFFASDMPGGFGGSDIYMCELINDKWSTPVNLGSKVNSIAKEVFPFMHSSGRLYFSSNRTGGAGGMDVYYTYRNQGKWEDPVLLPAEVNSIYDDFAFVAAENLQTGYFASNRNGRTDNIFKFTSTTIRKVKCDTLQYNNYCYEFYDENAIRFDTIPFRYIWDFGDGTNEEGVRVVHCFSGPGKYLARLDVVNLVTKETKKSEKTWDLEIKDIEQPFISGPSVCNIGKQITLNSDSTNLPGWNITQFYWNFGDETVATGKNVTKIFSKPGNYEVQLIVTGTKGPDGKVNEACVFKNINVIR